jgi:hypothetical protein
MSMSPAVLTYLRLAVTGVIAALSAAVAYYPHQYWIPIVITGVGAIGVHAVPSISQTTQTIPLYQYRTAEKDPKPPFTGA